MSARATLHRCSVCQSLTGMQAQYADLSSLSAYCHKCGDFRYFTLAATIIDARPGSTSRPFPDEAWLAEANAPYVPGQMRHFPKPKRRRRLRLWVLMLAHPFTQARKLWRGRHRQKPVDE